MSSSFEDQVALTCYEAYKNMGKKGKPEAGREWTKMSSVVQTNADGELKVISIATGTKCIGKNMRTRTGYILNDSHAEVLARRLLLKYFYQQLELSLLNSNKSIFTCSGVETRSFELRDGVKFHLFSTDIPCGDAAIFFQSSKKRKCEYADDKTKCQKKKNDENVPCTDSCESNFYAKCTAKMCEQYKTSDVSSEPTQFMKESCVTELDINRTGAKCVPSGNQDLMLPGINYHVVSALRIKPGRGDQTVSMSCSDKIMKWCVLGLQGGILKNFIQKSIFLSSIIIANVHFDIAAIKRSLSLRNRENIENLAIHVPEILHTTYLFEHRKEAIKCKTNTGKITPSGTAILWCQICNIHEVSANGRLHGTTKKDFNTSKIRTSVCKSSLFEDFKRISSKLSISGIEHMNYYDAKHTLESYENLRKSFFKVFPDWITKSKELEKFQ
ncbi:tRNA-specific adenosine deaminase 1 isoform X4 [Hydra vulgaris]|uniref:tRNA-specific adenosine deaminase 1 n=1 Tax=Hydra vulgaris TaxID=6087 RepID=A0ABM4DEU2_HYDVU